MVKNVKYMLKNVVNYIVKTAVNCMVKKRSKLVGNATYLQIWKNLHFFHSWKNRAGRFQQEAHISKFQDQRKADMGISVHEGLANGIIVIICWGRYNCMKFGM